jgi:hypothetical protein
MVHYYYLILLKSSHINVLWKDDVNYVSNFIFLTRYHNLGNSGLQLFMAIFEVYTGVSNCNQVLPTPFTKMLPKDT